MHLRIIGSVLSALWRALLTIQRGIETIMSQLDDLKTANAAEATAVSTALAAILALQAQHSEDLARLAAIVPPTDDSGELAALTTAIKDRAASITSALTTLQDKVAPAAAAAPATAPVVDPAPAAPAPVADPAKAPAAADPAPAAPAA